MPYVAKQSPERQRYRSCVGGVGAEGMFGAVAEISEVGNGGTARVLADPGANSGDGDVGIYNRCRAIGICVYRRSWSEMR